MEKWLLEQGFELKGAAYVKEGTLWKEVSKKEGKWEAVILHEGTGACRSASGPSPSEALREAFKALRKDALFIKSCADSELSVLENSIDYREVGKVL